jgi:hypothetical protein
VPGSRPDYSKDMPYRILVISLVLTAGLLAAQPATPAQSSAPTSVTVDQAFIQEQFGREFTLVPVSVPYTRDVDGDGVEDLVIVARSKKPMLDAAEHSYKVVDPYYNFYGYGDPKLTSTFGSEDLTEKNLVVLVIHGTGPDAWRSDKPKSKYVIINLPFKKASVRRLQLRKKQVNAIFAEEADSSAGDSVVFWDGKQYKYQPIGTSNAD